MKKYIVHPSFVKSKNDNDWHYISGDQLIRLYKLNRNEVIIVSEDYKNLKGLNIENFKNFYPKHNGNYKEINK